MPQINLHNFLLRSRANGPGERAVVWVQGCLRRCPGCFNPDSQTFATRELVSVQDLETRILAEKGLEGVTFSGGEPFCQAAQLAELAKIIHGHGLTVVCYTGYTLEQIRQAHRQDWDALLSEVDLLIDGPFIEFERCAEPYRGSANQRLIFLSGRISPEAVAEAHQTAELTLSLDGSLTATGFPEMMENISEFLLTRR